MKKIIVGSELYKSNRGTVCMSCKTSSLTWEGKESGKIVLPWVITCQVELKPLSNSIFSYKYKMDFESTLTLSGFYQACSQKGWAWSQPLVTPSSVVKCRKGAKMALPLLLQMKEKFSAYIIWSCHLMEISVIHCHFSTKLPPRGSKCYSRNT